MPVVQTLYLIVRQQHPAGLVGTSKAGTYADWLASAASVQPGVIVVLWLAESEGLAHVRV